MGKLQGKRAVVSGSSRGIGRGIAIQLAKDGAEVVLNYRSHGDEADEVIAACEAVGGKATKWEPTLPSSQKWNGWWMKLAR